MPEAIASLVAVVGADITGLVSALGVANTAILGFAGIAAAGLGKAIGAAADFDSSLKNIQATSGKSASEMANLNKQLLEIGAGTRYGPQAVADAMYDIVGGVTNASTHMDILKQSIATAEAGQADLKSTTQGLIYVMNAYSLSAKDAAMVSDVFTRTVGVGVGTMDQFVSALAPIAGTAKTIGVSFKDLGKMTAFLTTKGFSASESATELQSAFTALLKPNKAMKNALKAIGFESGSAALKALGFTEVLRRLRAQSGNSSDALAKMFGRVEAFKGVLALTGGDFAAFSENFEKGVKGATSAAQSIQNEAFTAQWEKFKSQLETIGITIGQAVLPVLSKLLGGVTAFFDVLRTGGSAWDALRYGLGEFIDNILKAVGFSDTAANAIQRGFFVMIDAAQNGINILKGIIGQLWSNIRNGLDLLKNGAPLGDVLTAWGMQLQDWISGIATRFGPQIIVAFNALWSGVSSWFSNSAWPAVQGAVQGFFQSITDFFANGGATQLVGGIVQAIGVVGNWIRDHGLETLQAGLNGLFQGLSTFFAEHGTADLIKGIGDAVIAAGKWLIDVGLPLVTSAFETIVLNILQVLGKITTGIVKSVTDGISQALAAARNAVSQGINGSPIARNVAYSLPFGVGNILQYAFGGGRAGGGPVQPGMAYRVGERGPETLVMGSRGGYINPNGGGMPDTITLVLQAHEFEQHIKLDISKSVRRGTAIGRGGG